MSSPSAKRYKSDSDAEGYDCGIIGHPASILAIEKTQPIPFTSVYVAKITNPKVIGKVLKTLLSRLPLSNLSHLRRVKKEKSSGENGVLILLTEISLVSEEELNNILISLKIEEYIVEITQTNVPSRKPLTRPQFESVKMIWPVNFFEHMEDTKSINKTLYSRAEVETFEKFMRQALHIGKEKTLLNSNTHRCTLSGCVIVDPTTNTVLSSGADSLDHPLHHAAMVAINTLGAIHLRNSKITTNVGIVDAAGAGADKGDNDDDEESTQPREPYLCNGLDVFITKEPCVMCSMALLHSRVRRVFFGIRDNENGGFSGSNVRIHCHKSLNHHFQVFEGLLLADCKLHHGLDESILDDNKNI